VWHWAPPTGNQSPLFAAIPPIWGIKRVLPQKKVHGIARHGRWFSLEPYQLSSSPMPTWPITRTKEKKPIKNRWQPLPHQTALLPVGIYIYIYIYIGSRDENNEPSPGVKNVILK
jgi:hypothetical protein